MVDSVAFATVGLGYGILFSILFKKKGKILGYGAGFGLGTAIYKNCGQDIN